jgi:hypothetical protein
MKLLEPRQRISSVTLEAVSIYRAQRLMGVSSLCIGGMENWNTLLVIEKHPSILHCCYLNIDGFLPEIQYSMHAPMKTTTKPYYRPSCSDPQHGGVDREGEHCLLDRNTSKLERNLTRNNNPDMCQVGSLDGNEKSINTSMRHVGDEPGRRGALKSSIRTGGAPQPECALSSNPSRELFCVDDGAAIEEETPNSITSSLESTEVSQPETPNPTRKEEDRISLQRYRVAEQLGVTVRSKKRRVRCQAAREANNMNNL